MHILISLHYCRFVRVHFFTNKIYRYLSVHGGGASQHAPGQGGLWTGVCGQVECTPLQWGLLRRAILLNLNVERVQGIQLYSTEFNFIRNYHLYFFTFSFMCNYFCSFARKYACNSNVFVTNFGFFFTPFAIEFFTVSTKLAEIATLASKDFTTAKPAHNGGRVRYPD